MPSIHKRKRRTRWLAAATGALLGALIGSAAPRAAGLVAVATSPAITHDGSAYRVIAPIAIRLGSLDVTGSILEGTRPMVRGAEPFGRPVFRTQDDALWRKWQDIGSQIDRDAEILRACRTQHETCSDSSSQLLGIVDASLNRSGRARIGHINRAINLAIRSTSDIAQFGVADVWSSPLATFASGRGDCEDYAIAKYLALQQAGIADEDLRIVIVWDTGAREDHAVLVVRLADRWLILDNRHHRLADAMDVKHLQPIVALDSKGVRRFAASH